MRALLFGLMLACGCYGPNIPDGALACAADRSCPSGMTCGGNFFCYRSSGLHNSLFGTGLLGDLDLTGKNGDVTFDTESGEVKVVSPALTVVPRGMAGFQHLTQPSGGPPVGLWNFANLTIPPSVNVIPSTDSASVLAIAATGTLLVRGNVSALGFGGFGGLAGMAGKPGTGAPANSVGLPAMMGNDFGGGGGAYGGNGQSGLPSTMGGAGGMTFGATNIPSAYFGSGGAGGSQFLQGRAGGGGNGGGAIVLLGKTVELAGHLDASGTNGRAGDDAAVASSGGGGGGAGGTIFVVGQMVKLDAGHSFTALGGLGGNGGKGGSSGGGGANGRVAIAGAPPAPVPSSMPPAVLVPSPDTFPR